MMSKQQRKKQAKRERDALRRENKKLKKLNNSGQMNKKLVAVYGSLRKEMHNHKYLKDAEYVGSYFSEPNFTLLDLGTYPGLIHSGATSVFLEVYEINDETLKSLDSLEGYFSSTNTSSNLYNRKILSTPYGDAMIYYYNNYNASTIGDYKSVTQGDWKDYYDTKSITQLVTSN